LFEGAKVCAKEMHTNTAVRQTDRQTDSPISSSLDMMYDSGDQS